jgi:hypothetical protein
MNYKEEFLKEIRILKELIQNLEILMMNKHVTLGLSMNNFLRMKKNGMLL